MRNELSKLLLTKEEQQFLMAVYDWQHEMTAKNTDFGVVFTYKEYDENNSRYYSWSDYFRTLRLDYLDLLPRLIGRGFIVSYFEKMHDELHLTEKGEEVIEEIEGVSCQS